MQHARQQLSELEPGHDVEHAQRVLRNALTIVQGEPGNLEVVIAAAILHDVADHKFFDESQAIQDIDLLLKNNDYPPQQRQQVIHIITHLSFTKEIGGHTAELTPEFCIVQDADRLDALGAIGIARAFSYGGYRRRPFYSATEASTIDHFHEKLLRLPQMMKTNTGRKLAKERKAFMLQFLTHFKRECGSDT